MRYKRYLVYCVEGLTANLAHAIVVINVSLQFIAHLYCLVRSAFVGRSETPTITTVSCLEVQLEALSGED